MNTEPLLLACLCAAWCRTCDEFRPHFDAVAAATGLRPRWIDIEDEAELVGDVDIHTFPTIAVVDAAGGARFFGTVPPQRETLARLVAAARAGELAPPEDAEVRAFAARLAAEEGMTR